MKKAEYILGTFAIVAIISKMFAVPLSGIIMVYSLTALGYLYLLGFALFNNILLRDIFKKESYKHTTTRKIVGSVFLGLSLTMVTIGTAYKLNFWPGAEMYLTTGLLGLLIILLLAAYYHYKTKNEFYNGVFKRIAIFGGLGLIIFLIPSDFIIDRYYGNYPDYAEQYKKVLANPNNPELRLELDQKREEMFDQQDLEY